MSIEEFLIEFRDQFETSNHDQLFEVDTVIQGVEGWGSLTSLMVLSMIDENYGVSVNGDELKSCETVGDLFELVGKKKD